MFLLGLGFVLKDGLYIGLLFLQLKIQLQTKSFLLCHHLKTTVVNRQSLEIFQSGFSCV